MTRMSPTLIQYIHGFGDRRRRGTTSRDVTDRSVRASVVHHLNRSNRRNRRVSATTVHRPLAVDWRRPGPPYGTLLSNQSDRREEAVNQAARAGNHRTR